MTKMTRQTAKSSAFIGNNTAFTLLMLFELFTLTLAFTTPSIYVSTSKSTKTTATTTPKTTTSLFEIIEALSENESPVDEGRGGVRLAQESAIKITGTVQHKPGSADATAKELLRYYKLSTVSSSEAKELLQKYGHTILCSGQGVELYKDPGETTMKEVQYAPDEAIKDALLNAASAMSSTHLVYNFLGGDDLMLGEVLNACNALTVDLDIPTKCRISFNSLCHNSIPAGTCTVTVASLNASSDNDEDATASSDTEKALAQGEVYSRDGVYYTLGESDINPAIA
jgi:hypothetical protein